MLTLPFVRQFDDTVAKSILRLPKYLQQPFHYLGWCFVPASWAAALAIYIVYTKNLTLLAASTLTLLLIPLATISKLAFRRQRPPTIYAGDMRIKSYSFPSSHAYAAALGGGFFAHLAFVNHLPVMGAALVLLAAIIGISRVYLGAHYPSDVIGGWLIGFAVLWAILASI